MCHAGIICGKFAFKCNNMCPFCRDPLFDDEDNDNNNKENIPLRRLTKRQKDKAKSNWNHYIRLYDTDQIIANLLHRFNNNKVYQILGTGSFYNPDDFGGQCLNENFAKKKVQLEWVHLISDVI
jgi:hypothetical protein